MFLLQLFTMILMLSPFRGAKESYLVVRGEQVTVKAVTSFGAINCTYTSPRKGDTLYLNRLLTKDERLVLYFPVKAFGCGNPLLNRDFQKTLNAAEHPQVRVEVLELVQEEKRLLGSLRLQLAGKTQVLRGVSFCHKPGQRLSADLCLNFSDFGLVTPKKLGGLIKVEEELQVTVDLLLALTQ